MTKFIVQVVGLYVKGFYHGEPQYTEELSEAYKFRAKPAAQAINSKYFLGRGKVIEI